VSVYLFEVAFLALRLRPSAPLGTPLRASFAEGCTESVDLIQVAGLAVYFFRPLWRVARLNLLPALPARTFPEFSGIP